MKRIFAVLLCVVSLENVHAADSSQEDQLIGVLQSEHSLREKAAACASLKRAGTARSVPALAALLTDNDLSHSARYVLESMPGPEAEQALLKAIRQTSGSNEVGIINSLAARRDPRALGALSRLLGSSDEPVAAAAARGLGRIGGAKAIKALDRALASGTGAVHDAEIDGLLAGANYLLTNGESAASLKIFQRLYDREKEEGIRLAAFRGVIAASGPRGVALMTGAIVSGDPATQGAALEMAVTMPGTAATAELAGLLPSAPMPVQIALLQCLGQRADPTASSAVAGMMEDSDPNVRLAAISALGDLGDSSAALPLANHAATATGPERNAARQSLVDLRRGPVAPALIAALSDPAPKVRLEVIRALGDRGDVSAAGAILQLARADNHAIGSASLQALELLGGTEQVPDVLQIVVQSTNDDERAAAAGVLDAIYQRLQSQGGHWDIQPFLSAVKNAPIAARIALLPVCSGLTEPPVRETLRDAINDSDSGLREAAIRALCETRDGALLTDLLKVAHGAQEKKFQALAVGGCVRLAAREERVKLPLEKKIAAFKEILDIPLDAAEKRLVLSGLETIPDEQALALAAPMLDDSEVRPEAVQAVITIAGTLSATHPGEAGAALKKVLAAPLDSAARESAENALKKIQ